ncbi:MAG: hypothetical protein IPL61_31080 [Myxococcales bacterium]|nr:hypothetical protein [Myxococcales bacterium]
MRRVLGLAPLFSLLVVACGGDTGDPQVGECEDYCDLITAHCSGAVAQYSDRNSCLATCEVMPLGEPATHAGHTVACRTFQAAAAELDAAATCPSAGPGGAGVCGSDCESFCAMTDEICGDLSPYATSAECLSACAGFASLSPFDASDIAGDTIECRLYHLTAASVAPGTHCPHLAVVSSTCQ